jgi:tetratricopeptide (TPR) repeat protein
MAGLFAFLVLFVTKGLVNFFSGGAEATLGQKMASLLLAFVCVSLVTALLYFARKLGRKYLDFQTGMDDVTQQWMLAVASGFIVMSFVLVVLANPKGDLQDGFIQKVKFISSHGLFVIWIGYGLAFGLVIAYRILKSLVRTERVGASVLKPARVVLCCLGLMTALIPVYENYNNDYLVFAMSGAEQNGHDFGWQFGNYQLRGADAVTEELEADEEPLPNPVYPPEMTQDAVFFGGTDPGRFVPTYMIYSARVRPDVFLITQNALADNTYMNTMRDLYGNEMWIPTPEDSAKAFQIYVDEVQAGKRQANAALTIDNGRVQVSGALGVMEINGILCDMMFAKNKIRHDFYIEESYVIPWMYPYLSPHGLIMKINQEKIKFTKELIQDDMDFWDWYSRKLVRGYTFRRDLPAQKSFSKLRSAIAGLYANTGFRKEAEDAYREARLLYPLSPEASFRMLQEITLPQARYEEAEDVLSYFVEKDPNNDRAVQFLDFVTNVNTTQKRIQEIVEKGKTEQKLSPEDAYELAMAYRQIGQNQSTVHYLKRLAATGAAGLPPNKQLEVALTLSSLKQHEDAVNVMNQILSELPSNTEISLLQRVADLYRDAQKIDQYTSVLMMILKVNPNHWQSWISMAEIYMTKGQAQQMQYAIQKAVSIGQGAALQSIEKNPALKSAAIPIIQQMMQKNPAVLPGLGQR